MHANVPFDLKHVFSVFGKGRTACAFGTKPGVAKVAAGMWGLLICDPHNRIRFA
jgi:hypothetical protein